VGLHGRSSLTPRLQSDCPEVVPYYKTIDSTTNKPGLYPCLFLRHEHDQQDQQDHDNFGRQKQMESHQQPGNRIRFIAAVSQNLSGGGDIQNIQDDEEHGQQEQDHYFSAPFQIPTFLLRGQNGELFE
jgi:hypothetical protein